MASPTSHTFASGPVGLIALLALAGGCSSGGTVANAGGSAAAGGMTTAASGGSPVTGGVASSGLGGTSTLSGGGASATGGKGTGGEQATGGTSAPNGSGTSATGGKGTGGEQATGGKMSTSPVVMGGKTSTSTAATGGATSTTAGGTSSSTDAGGTKAAGGNTTSSSGGVTSVGGTQSGGTKATGGASQSSTGGKVATGGAGSSTVPTGLPSSCGSTNCDAATPVNPQLTSYGALGNVTEYSTSASNAGACLYGSTKVMYYAAINVNLSPGDGKGQWQGGKACGQCMEVTVLTSTGTKSVVVRIMDKCPDGYCGIDLGGTAPSVVMGTQIGRYQGAWRAVSCAGHDEVFDGVPSIHVKDGASEGWSVIQVRNPMTGVAGIDWQWHNDPSTHGTLTLDSGIENYYDVPALVLQASSSTDLTIRYVDGTTGTVTLTPGQLATPEGTYPLD